MIKKKILGKAFHNYGRIHFDLGDNRLAAWAFQIAAHEHDIKESKNSLRYMKDKGVLPLQIPQDKTPKNEDKDLPLVNLKKVKERIAQCMTDQHRYELGILWCDQGNALDKVKNTDASLFWEAACLSLNKIHFAKQPADLYMRGTEEVTFFIKVSHNRGMLFYKLKNYNDAATEFNLAHAMGSEASGKNVQQMITDGLIGGGSKKKSASKASQSSSKKTEQSPQELCDLGIKSQSRGDWKKADTYFKRVIYMLHLSDTPLSLLEERLLSQAFYHSGLKYYHLNKYSKAVIAFGSAPHMQAAEDRLFEMKKTGELQKIVDQEPSKITKEQLKKIDAYLQKKYEDELDDFHLRQAIKDIEALDVGAFFNEIGVFSQEKTLCVPSKMAVSAKEIQKAKFTNDHLIEMQRVVESMHRFLQPTDLLVAIGRSPLYYTYMLQALHPEVTVLEMPFSNAENHFLDRDIEDSFKEHYKNFMTYKGLGGDFFDPNHLYKNVVIIDYMNSGRTIASFQELLARSDLRFKEEGRVKILALIKETNPYEGPIILNHSIIVGKGLDDITFSQKHGAKVSYGVGLPFNPNEWHTWKELDSNRTVLSPVAKARLNQIDEWVHNRS